ncbi:MAG TPA: SRPBCC domain-containing protein [Rhizomicrobium sp.]|nr:SRPBCC domain-containing protein [Rhizomicrobium sp.]
MKTILGFATAALCFAQAAQAGAIKDTSFRDADGHRVQQLETVIDAPVAKVWAAFTTDEGFKAWGAPVVHITPGHDGMLEASYLPASKIGDAENIRNRFVVYFPEHLLVIRNEHAPKGGPFKQEIIDKISTVFEFEDIGGGKTRLIESGVGYGEGADFDSMYKRFHDGNAEELDLLEKSFVKGPIDWKAEMGEVDNSVKTPAAKP